MKSNEKRKGKGFKAFKRLRPCYCSGLRVWRISLLLMVFYEKEEA